MATYFEIISASILLILYFGVIGASLLCALALVVGSFIIKHFPNSKIAKWLKNN